MIPIKYAATGAAFVFHNQTEGTPNQDTNQIAYVKENRDHEKDVFIEKTLPQFIIFSTDFEYFLKKSYEEYVFRIKKREKVELL